jgi:hypothetical protein
MYQELLSLWLKNHDTIVKVVALLATPGGIWFWIDKYQSRVQIRIRNVRLTGSSDLGIAFEAENVSSVLTSYERILHLTGYHSDRAGRKKLSYKFTVQNAERQLTPLVEKSVVAIDNETGKPKIIFLWYMTLTVTLTRGRKVRVRIRGAEFKTIGFLRFQWERFLFLTFGMTP